MGESEKQLRILHFSRNFHYAFIAAVFGTVGDEAVFKNLVLARRRATQRQQAVIVIDRYFNNHLITWPSLVGTAEYHKWKSPVISGRSLADWRSARLRRCMRIRSRGLNPSSAMLQPGAKMRDEFVTAKSTDASFGVNPSRAVGARLERTMLF